MSSPHRPDRPTSQRPGRTPAPPGQATPWLPDAAVEALRAAIGGGGGVTDEELTAALAGVARAPTSDAEREAFVPARLSDAALRALFALLSDPRLTDARPATDASVAALVNAAASATRAALGAAYGRQWSPRSVPGEAGLPRLMASPPTISAAVAGDLEPNIAGKTFIRAVANLDWSPTGNGVGVLNTGAFKFGGSPWRQKSLTGAYPDYAFAGPLPDTELHGEGANYTYVEFLYFGQSFQFGYKAAGDRRMRVWVDGQQAEPLYTDSGTFDGGAHWRTVTFAAAGWHRGRLDLGPIGFSGLVTAPGDVVQAVPVLGDKLLVIGDSFAEGTGADYMGGYPVLLGAMLGFDDVVGLAQGGTGLVATNSGVGRTNYAGRAADWAQIGATHVLVQMSGNDDGYTGAQVAAAMTDLMPRVMGLPGSPKVWVVGQWANNGAGAVDRAKARDAITRPIAQAAGALFVSQVEPQGIWTGTGHVGAPAGDGTCDVLVGADGTHPTQAGHEGIARSLFARLLAALR